MLVGPEKGACINYTVAVVEIQCALVSEQHAGDSLGSRNRYKPAFTGSTEEKGLCQVDT